MSHKLTHKLIQVLPKAELHLHIEGTFEPELMLEIATRNRMLNSLPFQSLADAKRAYNFMDLQSFLNLYYAGCAVLLTQQDFFELTWCYLQKAATNNVVYVEIMFDPQIHTERGVDFGTIVKGITQALRLADTKLGIQGNLMMNFVRHLGPEAAITTLKQAEPYKHLIVAVGLDSTELGWPPSLWRQAFQEAATQGYLLSAHAGEEGPAEYIWEALRILKVKRIDHGVHCIEDAELLAYLREHAIPLTVCPLSNLKLKVYDGHLEKKLQFLVSQNLFLTINADDPSYFGGYENANLEWLADNVLNGNVEKIYTYISNGFKAAFIDEERKLEYLQQLSVAFQKVICQTEYRALSRPEV